jgi:hypothetical protein
MAVLTVGAAKVLVPIGPVHTKGCHGHEPDSAG